MSFLLRCRTVVASVLCLMGSALAAGPAPRPPDPLDPQADVPSARHRSVVPAMPAPFDVAVGDWPRANAHVARVGGWRAYAREAAAPAPAASATASGAQR